MTPYDEDGMVTALSLGSNNLRGFIPEEIRALSSIAILIMADNALTDSIPAGVFLPSLVDLQLQSNQLSRPLPENMGDAAGLVEI